MITRTSSTALAAGSAAAALVLTAAGCSPAETGQTSEGTEDAEAETAVALGQQRAQEGPRAAPGEGRGGRPDEHPGKGTDENAGDRPAENARNHDWGDESDGDAPSLEEFVAQAEWSVAPLGVHAEQHIQLTDGSGTGDYRLAYPEDAAPEQLGRKPVDTTAAYELGEVLIGDVTGDGVEDAVASITASSEEIRDEELWYIWRGVEDGETIAEQIPHPIASAQECADVVDEVSIADGAVRTVTRQMTYHDVQFEDGATCATDPNRDRERTISAQQVDGAWYPVQQAPTQSWGGICPEGTALEGWWVVTPLLTAPSPSAPPAERASTGTPSIVPVLHGVDSPLVWEDRQVAKYFTGVPDLESQCAAIELE